MVAWGMARLARLVIPGMPHHVTQRGNRRQETFFNEGDYAAYLELMVEWCREEGVEIWGYCLMPNHTHLIAVPAAEQSLRRAIGEAHRRYTRRINFREKWRGYLWQGRFASFVMDEPYLLAAARYVELNPVRRDWRQARPSGVGAVRGRTCRARRSLVKVGPLLGMVGDWQGLLDSALREEELEELRGHGRTGRPLGDEAFLERLEGLVGRVLKPQKGGRPRNSGN